MSADAFNAEPMQTQGTPASARMSHSASLVLKLARMSVPRRFTFSTSIATCAAVVWTCTPKSNKREREGRVWLEHTRGLDTGAARSGRG
jgi:hypothetical protein